MIAAHFRAYRSEPPPTAVLMTNSTGLVGCTIVATDAAEPLGVGAVPVLLAQAVRVMSAAARIAVIRIADLDMTRTSMLQVRTAVSKGSHRRSDRDLSCHNGGSGSARGVRSAGPELVRSRGRARSVGHGAGADQTDVAATGRRPRYRVCLPRRRVHPRSGRQGERPDARVQLRDRRLRGHPCLLERAGRTALRPPSKGAFPPAPQ